MAGMVLVWIPREKLWFMKKEQGVNKDDVP
jgi:hypothetical protein